MAGIGEGSVTKECRFFHDAVDACNITLAEGNIQSNDSDKILQENPKGNNLQKERVDAEYHQDEGSSNSLDGLLAGSCQKIDPESIMLHPSVKRRLAQDIAIILLGLLVGVLLSMLGTTVIRIFEASSAGTRWNGWPSIENVFIFGDSWTDFGFDPAGAQPSPENPIGNPSWPGTSSANATNWVGFLTAKYNTSFVKTYNLAAGGATLDNKIIQAYPIPVTSQVYGRFMPHYGLGHEPAWDATNTLFIMFAGVVDLIMMNRIREPEQLATVNNNLTVVFSKMLHSLYGAGARNFLLLGTPPLERCWQPGANGPSVSAKLKTDGIVYNQRVLNAAKGLKEKYKDTNVWFLDVDKLFNQALDNPKSFPQTSGILNTTTPCAAYGGGNPTPEYFLPECLYPVNRYFWLNGLHPTYPVHDALADQIVKLLDMGPNIV